MDQEIIKRENTKEFALDSAFERAHLEGRISSLGYGYIAVPAMNRLILERDEVADSIKKTLSSFAFPPSAAIFGSGSLNPFINELIAFPSYVVEVEKEYLEACFVALRKEMGNRILINPSKGEKVRYGEPGIVYLYPLMSKSPVSKDGSIRVEKLLVDLIVSPRYQSLYSGMDIKQALRIIVNGYAVNYRTLFAYASRKRRTKEVYAALMEAAEGQIKELLNDIEEEL